MGVFEVIINVLLVLKVNDIELFLG